MDTGDKKEDSPPEEKILQPAIPVDMKQYLQVIAAVAQKQVGAANRRPGYRGCGALSGYFQK